MPIIEHIRQGSETLVIAIPGLNFRFNIPTESLLAEAGLSDQSHIVLVDKTRRMCMLGLDEYDSLESLLAYLQAQINKLKPSCVLVIGSSAGGHTAMLFGHFLRADYVLAFGPYTHIGSAAAKKYNDPVLHTMRRLIASNDALPKYLHSYFDLADALQEWNQKTHYYVHYCWRNLPDRERCGRLKNVPALTLVRHPYRDHSVIGWLSRDKQLRKCFDLPYQLPRLSNLDYCYRYLHSKVGRIRRKFGWVPKLAA